VEGARSIHFTRQDVVRHPLVGRIVEAYDRDEKGALTHNNKPAADFSKGLIAEACVEDARWTAALGQDAQTFAQSVVTAIEPFFDPQDEELAVLFTQDEAVKALNMQWRGKDAPTNVLAFPASDQAETLGDIALAYETCAREAAEQGKSLKDHATHLLVHGVLHLLGYDHDNDSDALEMEGLEKDILATLGIDDPYVQHV
jgi:probable rRNA maturation factor